MLLGFHNLTMMILLSIGTGLLLIGLGYLVEKYPDLIAGYNTMPQAQKEKFDIKGYASLMKKAFVVVGLVIMLFGIIGEVLQWPYGLLLTALVPILALVVFLNLKAERYKL